MIDRGILFSPPRAPVPPTKACCVCECSPLANGAEVLFFFFFGVVAGRRSDCLTVTDENHLFLGVFFQFLDVLLYGLLVRGGIHPTEGAKKKIRAKGGKRAGFRL